MEVNYSYSTSFRGNLDLVYGNPVTRPRLCIIGHGRSGKDTAAEILGNLYGFTYDCSSMAAAKIFIYEELRDEYGYQSFEECYEDRHNHRALWYDMITGYNSTNPARLAGEIMKNSDIYVGMRSRRELQESKHRGLFDLVIWIDASLRVPDESPDSFNIGRDAADIVVDNNGTEIDFYNRIKALGAILSGEVFGVNN